MARCFYSDSVLTLEEMVKLVNEDDLYFSVKCDQYDLSHLLLHCRMKRKEVSSGVILLLQLCLQFPVGDNLL